MSIHERSPHRMRGSTGGTDRSGCPFNPGRAAAPARYMSSRSRSVPFAGRGNPTENG
ncbi:MAG: hypothetical protein AB1847_02100 [bacterium]